MKFKAIFGLLIPIATCLVFLYASTPSPLSSLVMTMMIRDEEVNINSNLPLWASVVNYFVILVDERTIDHSAKKVSQILKAGNRPHVILNYTFTGFGQARTLSLNYAWQFFPNATHVLIADPDWKPDLSTIKLTELDNSADVFRFIVFDRNGITRRRIDWLLRHKADLKMRYSLHEVLDIGLYEIKPINWIVHEIEQIGTWHATVGHGHSHGITRYEFDLKLLNRDLILYPNDSHVDYYLGITYYAYAEAIFSQTGILNKTSLERSVHFLERRLYSTYTDEFVEERWAAMYTLGGIFASFLTDYSLAVRWFSLCRDYNRKQVECSVQLARVLLLVNRFDLAQIELENLLQQEVQERLMLNMLHTVTCAVPSLVMDINSIKFSNSMLSRGDAWFQLLMISSFSTNSCSGSSTSINQAKSIVSSVLEINPDSYLSDPLKICLVNELQIFLINNRFQLHPCSEFRARLALESTCSSFVLPTPPASEEYQLSSRFRQFLGAASFPDIIHHIYGGDDSLLFRRSKEQPLRSMLSPNGVIGLTYFSRNIHVSRLKEILKKANPSNLVPFSIEAKNIIRNYLKLHGLRLFLEDTELLKMLGEEPVERIVPPRKVDDLLHTINCTWFSRKEIEAILHNHGFKPGAWIPTAYSHPYTELTDYIIFKHFASGLEEEAFIEEYFTNFRHSVYATFKEFSSSRFNLDNNYFQDEILSAVVMLEDRTGTLESTLSKLPSSLASSVFRLNPFYASYGFVFEINVSPQVATAFSVLRDRCSLYQILLKLSDASLSDGVISKVGHFSTEVMKVLRLLEATNAITLSYDSVAISHRRAIAQHLDDFSKGFQAINVLILGKCDKFSAFPVFQSANSTVCVSRMGHFPPRDRMQIVSSLHSAEGKYNIIVLLEKIPSHTILQLVQKVDVETMVLLDICHKSAVELRLKELEIFEMRQLFTFSCPCATGLLISRIKLKGTSHTPSHRTSIEDPQFQHMRQLGFDTDFISNFERPIQVVVDQDQNSKIRELEETKSSLKNLLKVLRRKNFDSFNDSETDQKSFNSDEENPLSLQQLANHTATSQKVLLPGKLVSLDSTYRRKDCWGDGVSITCSEPKPIRRKTAAIDVISINKLNFDYCQLEMLIRLQLIDIKFLKEFEKILSSNQWLTSKVIKATPAFGLNHLNRAIYTESDDSLDLQRDLFSWKVIQHLEKAFNEARNADFAVFDAILREKALQHFLGLLQRSTIWFDLTNGDYFASHFDDGLNFNSLVVFAQQLTAALAAAKKVKIVKYFALSSNSSLSSSSPILLANREEIAIAFFLNERESSEDGLLLYDSKTADCLFAQGVSRYPSVHPDFLSKNGEMMIHVNSICGTHQSEFIPRKKNRMVVVRAKSPFLLQNRQDLPSKGDFTAEVLFTLIIIVNIKA